MRLSHLFGINTRNNMQVHKNGHSKIENKYFKEKEFNRFKLFSVRKLLNLVTIKSHVWLYAF